MHMELLISVAMALIISVLMLFIVLYIGFTMSAFDDGKRVGFCSYKKFKILYDEIKPALVFNDIWKGFDLGHYDSSFKFNWSVAMCEENTMIFSPFGYVRYRLFIRKEAKKYIVKKKKFTLGLFK